MSGVFPNPLKPPNPFKPKEVFRFTHPGLTKNKEGKNKGMAGIGGAMTDQSMNQPQTSRQGVV